MKDEKDMQMDSLNSFQEVREMLEGTRMGRWNLLVEGDVVKLYMDDMMAELTGIPKDTDPVLANDMLVANVDDADKAAFSEYGTKLVQEKIGEIEYAYHHPNKGPIYIRCFGAKDNSYPDKSKVMIRGYHRDITEQYVQKKLLNYSLMVTEALASEYMNVHLVNPHARTVEVLKENGAFLDPTKQEEVEKFSYDFVWDDYIKRCVHPDDQDMVRKASNLDKVLEMLSLQSEYRFIYRRNANGTFSYYHSIFRKLSDGYIINGFSNIDKLVKQDAEQRALLEDALLAAEQANRAKTVFLNNMSHDIRTPMNAIVGMTQVAKKSISDEARMKDCLEKIEIASGHLLSLINDVLDMSKLESGAAVIKNESVDLHAIMNECFAIVSSMAQESDVSIILHPEDKPKHRFIMSSPLHLRQIFINLAGNAIKYNKQGGKLELFCKERIINQENVEFTFIFEDTGIGMEQSFIEKVFEPFAQERLDSRTKYKGTGLGLPIVKTLVEEMHGTIEVESQKNIGSKFTVTLPFQIDLERMQTEASFDETKQNNLLSEEEILADISGLHVLLVEDNDLNLEIAEFILEDEGAIVEAAVNGEEAVDLLVRQKKNYDVVLMDIMMPKMDGYQATKEIRKAGIQIPIIAMTANAFSEDRIMALESGMNEHVAKPINVDLLKNTICKCLNEEKRVNYMDTPAWDQISVLLVEDNELIREIEYDLLMQTGAKIEAAEDGIQAVKMLRAAKEHPFDIIFMDIQMPEMNGYEVCKMVRAWPNPVIAKVPIFALTASENEVDKKLAMDVGMNGFISKPIDFKTVSETIQRAVRTMKK